MRNKWNKNYLRIGVIFTVSLCIAIIFNQVIHGWRVIFNVIGRIFSALTPFIIGIIIAYILSPVMTYVRQGLAFLVSKISKTLDYDKAHKRVKGWAVFVTIVFFITLITVFLWLVIPHIYQSLKDLVDSFPGYVESVQAWIDKIFSKNEALEGRLTEALNYVEDNITTIFESKIMPNMDTIVLNVSSGIVVGVKAVFNFLVGIIVAVYLLYSKNTLIAQAKKFVYLFFSKKTGNKILEGLSYANSVFGGFINGKILDSLIIGIICFVFTSAFGMRYAVLISVIVGVTNIIPFFGPFIGAIPGALLALMDDPMMFIIFIIFVLLLQQFDGNILGPLILGDSTGLSGMWVLVAILVGGDLFGVAGMILGVPVFACLYALFAVMLRDGLRNKNLSSDTEDYHLLKGFDEETGEPIYRDKHEKRQTLKKRKKKHFYDKMLKKKQEENYNKDNKEIINADITEENIEKKSAENEDFNNKK
ncbi:MAG: AI-2E family transporter [Lachnospiraceae bacterium]|nr:AI-2E family transporter [Lachnospiraceae bacterium]